jgi:AcrR family transcriptional regulator
VPKISGRSLQEHRTQTRQRVFDALMTLLDRSSFDAISMAELAAEAGIGRTAIYNHFPDKDSVLVGFATSETSKYLARLQAVLAQHEDPEQRLRAYVSHHIDIQGEQHFGFGPEINGQLTEQARAAIREHVREVGAVVRAIIADGIESGQFRDVPVEETVRLLQACLQPRNVPADVVADFVVHALRV